MPLRQAGVRFSPLGNLNHLNLRDKEKPTQGQEIKSFDGNLLSIL